jgi:hypothetical protein
MNPEDEIRASMVTAIETSIKLLNAGEDRHE